MSKQPSTETQKDDLILVTGAGGFIGGALVRYFKDKGFTNIRAVDKKPLPIWYQITDGVESISMDLTNEEYCKRAVQGAREVYNLAADMGGMGFIERFRIMCLRSILINTHLIEAAYQRRRGALFLLFLSLRLQHEAPGRRHIAARSRRPTPIRLLRNADTVGRNWFRKCFARNTRPSAA